MVDRDVLHEYVPPGVREIMGGRREVPVHTASPFPRSSYGCPPALIPIWATDMPPYVGLWKRWFGDRRTVVVELNVEYGWRVRGLARNAGQCLDRVLAIAITADDGIADAARAFAAHFGVDEAGLARIDALTSETGDEDAGLLALSAFAAAPPLICSPAGRYTGDFPHDGMALSPDRPRDFGTVEISPAPRRTSTTGAPRRPPASERRARPAGA